MSGGKWERSAMFPSDDDYVVGDNELRGWVQKAGEGRGYKAMTCNGMRWTSTTLFRTKSEAMRYVEVMAVFEGDSS
jgi:hypothetical protein